MRDEDGQVVANIITIDSVDVEVSEEVFLAYSQMDRRERYQQEQQLVHPQISLELLSEHEVPIDLYLNEHQISAEENVLNLEEQLENYIKQERLKAAMDSLDKEKWQLLQALFSTREAAERSRMESVFRKVNTYDIIECKIVLYAANQTSLRANGSAVGSG